MQLLKLYPSCFNLRMSMTSQLLAWSTSSTFHFVSFQSLHTILKPVENLECLKHLNSTANHTLRLENLQHWYIYCRVSDSLSILLNIFTGVCQVRLDRKAFSLKSHLVQKTNQVLDMVCCKQFVWS